MSNLNESNISLRPKTMFSKTTNGKKYGNHTNDITSSNTSILPNWAAVTKPNNTQMNKNDKLNSTNTSSNTLSNDKNKEKQIIKQYTRKEILSLHKKSILPTNLKNNEKKIIVFSCDSLEPVNNIIFEPDEIYKQWNISIANNINNGRTGRGRGRGKDMNISSTRYNTNTNTNTTNPNPINHNNTNQHHQGKTSRWNTLDEKNEMNETKINKKDDRKDKESYEESGKDRIEEDLWDDISKNDDMNERPELHLMDMAQAAEKFRLEMQKLKQSPNRVPSETPDTANIDSDTFGDVESGQFDDINENTSNLPSQVSNNDNFKPDSVNNKSDIESSIVLNALKDDIPEISFQQNSMHNTINSNIVVNNETRMNPAMMMNAWATSRHQNNLAEFSVGSNHINTFNPLMMNNNLASNQWFYLDPQGNQQGPFSNDEMKEWYERGYFMPNLPIRFGIVGSFIPLGSFFNRDQIPFALGNNINHHLQIQQQQALLLIQQQQNKELEENRIKLLLEKENNEKLEREKKEKEILEKRLLLEKEEKLKNERSQKKEIQEKIKEKKKQEQSSEFMSVKEKKEETFLKTLMKGTHQETYTKKASVNQEKSKKDNDATKEIQETIKEAVTEKDNANVEASKAKTLVSKKSWGDIDSQNYKKKTLVEIQEEEQKLLKEKMLLKEKNHEKTVNVTNDTELVNMGEKLKLMLGVGTSVDRNPDKNNNSVNTNNIPWKHDNKSVESTKSLRDILAEEEMAAAKKLASTSVSKKNNIKDDIKPSRWVCVVAGPNHQSSTLEPAKTSLTNDSVKITESNSTNHSVNDQNEEMFWGKLKRQDIQDESNIKKVEIDNNVDNKNKIKNSTGTLENHSNKNNLGASIFPKDVLIWCRKHIKELIKEKKKTIDKTMNEPELDDTSIIDFLSSLDDVGEIRQYLATYLGSTPKVSNFATEFIQKKKLYYKNNKQNKSVTNQSFKSKKPVKRLQGQNKKDASFLLNYSIISNRPNKGEIDFST